MQMNLTKPFQYSYTIFNDVYEIDNNIDYIGSFSFFGSQTLKNLVVPKNVIQIDNRAFGQCKNLKDVYFNKDAKTILKDGVFHKCVNLTNIHLPHNLEYISGELFRDCSNISHISLPHTIQYIGMDAFSKCINLQKILIPKSCIKIEKFAFFSCMNLSELTIISNNLTIDENAFALCKNLKTIKIIGNIKHIDNTAFIGCLNLTKIISTQDMQKFKDAFKTCINLKF